MSSLVVDASVMAKWVVSEEHTADAWRVLVRDESLHAPDFALLEIDSVLCRRLRRRLLTMLQARGARHLLERFPVSYVPAEQFRDDAFDLAAGTSRSPYDCLYLALALRLDGRLVTADRRFYDAIAAGPHSDSILWIEDA